MECNKEHFRYFTLLFWFEKKGCRSSSILRNLFSVCSIS